MDRSVYNCKIDFDEEVGSFQVVAQEYRRTMDFWYHIKCDWSDQLRSRYSFERNV